MLSVAEALTRILALAPKLPSETIALHEAAGRWAAEDVLARRTQPTVDLSAMDGYAIRFDELPGPWTVSGESAAGRGLARALAPGEAARIFTGAAVPAGADTILVQENAHREADRLSLRGEAPTTRGASVRRAGSDFVADERLVAAGALLTPARIALAAAGGHGAMPVRRRVRVALICTGDELVAPGQPTPGNLLPSSNAPMLAALLGGLPVEVCDLGIVGDDLALLTAAFTRAAASADILVVTGGASVGDHDLVRPALDAAGAAIDFWQVAVKPGKPLLAGRLGAAAVLGLPGNPVSAFVTAWLFLLPLLRSAMGGGAADPRRQVARLAGTLPATGGRTEFVRARRVGGRVRPAAGQDSAGLRSLSNSDALIVRQPHAAAAKPGDVVEIVDIA